MSTQHTPVTVVIDGHTYRVIGRSVVEITGPDSRKPVYGAIRAAAIAKATGSAA